MFLLLLISTYFLCATNPLPVAFRQNLRSSSLASPTQFSPLDVKSGRLFIITFTSCLDGVCPLSSRPACTTPSNPWLSDVLREHWSKLRAAERKLCKSKDPADLSMYQSLFSYFSVMVHTAKTSYFHKINSASDAHKLLNIQLSPLLPSAPSHHHFNS